MREFTFSQNNDSALSIKDFLKSKGVSKEIIKKIKFGGVFLNGKALSTFNDVLNKGDEIKIVLPKDEPNPFVKAVKGELTVLYEDEFILAVDKPSGMQIHASKSGATSFDALVLGYLEPEVRVFRAVNRLDRDTSGVVLVAKDEFTASLLSENLKKGDFRKTYEAVVKGVPKENSFTVEKPIKRLNDTGMERVVAEDGKYAKTVFTLIKSLGNGLSILKAEPITGRTHQIRVHLASEGLPLFADALYGERVEGKTFSLVARELEFTHPHKNERVKVVSKIRI